MGNSTVMHEEDQREIEAMGVWPVLRGNLWHATSVAKSAGIIKDSEIRMATRPPTRLRIATKWDA